jgi:putative transposase
MLSPGIGPQTHSGVLKGRDTISGMPQSLSRIVVHLVFSTRQRVPLLAKELRGDIHSFMMGVLRKEGCTPIQAGGVEDHVHLLFGLSRTKTVALLTSEVKTSSTKWLKERSPQCYDFHWQAGYGSWSVSPGDIQSKIEYIQNQEEHHKHVSFQDEYRQLLLEQGIEFDERYIWD